MKTTKRQRRLFGAGLQMQALAAALLLMAPSCESIYDEEGDCSVTYRVAVRFTNNMLGADAFSTQVPSVNLYVFDHEDGHLERIVRESAPWNMEGSSYTMVIDVPAGTYDLVAWGGLSDTATFLLNAGAEPATMDEATIRLKCETTPEGDFSSQALTPLFHAGQMAVTCPADTFGVVTVATLDLIKDTNTIRVMLAHNEGPIAPSDFHFAITADNGQMDAYNQTIPGHSVTYTEWTKDSYYITGDELAADEPADGPAAAPQHKDSETRADYIAQPTSAVLAELDMARLLLNHRRDAVLTVTADGQDAPVLSVSLIELLLRFKGANHASMGDQEFLDRQDEYNFVFYINQNNGWYMNGNIYINSWHMRLQDSDL